MKPKAAYLALAVLGAVLPYWKFVAWLAEHGLSSALFFQELFVNRISTFFAMDVIVSAVVLIRFIRVESFRLDIRKWWIPVAGTLAVGVSFGLPLFLYMRERKLEASADSH
jgi:uncharacterized protein DUF2834